ncbi:MAG TPA: SpvB/TcaC N-terminal domain-containing protein [bacterium]
MHSRSSCRRKSFRSLALSAPLLVLAMALGSPAAQAAAPPGMAGPDPAGIVPLLLDGSRLEALAEPDPTAGINLIAAPEANSLGEAALSYPLEIPPGRRGMQPRLEVAYSSGAGNGWLGLGWNLSAPMITVDTRWGVPRYSPTHETETYLLEGRQLTPLAHRADPLPRAAGDRVFHARVEGAFDRIVRHGAGPGACWWEVTDTDGTVYSYGGRRAAGGFESGAVLTDDPVLNGGNVFVWALREIRDTHGNTVLFEYERVESTGLAQGTEPGHDLYLKSVRYTGFQGEPGPYAVSFVRDRAGDTPRPDAVIDALGGFKRVTGELLRRVEVTFEDPVSRAPSVVRSYDFSYVTGAFEKTLLSSVTQRGQDGAAFHTHTFGYYDEVSAPAGGYAGFGEKQTWNTGYDNLGEYLPLPVSSGAISSGVSDAGGFSVYGGFNLWIPQKFGSAGFSVGGHWSDSRGLLELVDVDGDSLPDKLFEDGGRLYYRPNTSGPAAGAAVTFGERAEIPGLPAIATESTSSFFFGPEVHAGLQGLESNAWTWADQSNYLADANGDGLIDLVDAGAGQVHFNHRGAGGSPSFDTDSSDTPVPIAASAVDTAGILGDRRACRTGLGPCVVDFDCPTPGDVCVPIADVLVDNYPLVDTVRRWVAPWDGRVAITGAAALAGGGGCERYAAADGVRVAIQHNGDELWAADIPPAGGPVSPRDVGNVQVRAGDRIYFRVQSVANGACDEVRWEPAIDYRAGQAPADANLLDPYHYSASGDFVLAGRRGARVWLPVDGTVRLDGAFRKTGPTSDDVAIQVYYGADANDPGSLLLSQPVAWDETAEIAPTLDIPVTARGWVLLRVQTDSPIDLTRISWAPRLYYTAASVPGALVDRNGNPIFQLNPPYDIDGYTRPGPGAPQEPWIAPYTGRVTASVGVPVPPFLFTCPEGQVVFTVKRPGELVAKAVLQVALQGQVCVASDASVSFAVTKGDSLFFDYSVFSPELSELFPQAAYPVSVAYDPASIDPPAHGPTAFTLPGILRGSEHPGLLHALPHRGWSVFGYNGNRERAARPIDEQVVGAYDAGGYGNGSAYDPRRAPAWPFMPWPATSIWLGPDDRTWAAAGLVSPSRLGADDVRVPGSGGLALGPAVRRHSTSFQAVAGGGFFIAGFSKTIDAWTTGDVDYLDMNGDLFPDVVSGGHVQYTSPLGALEAAKTAVDGFAGDEVRRTGIDSWNVGLGADLSLTPGDAQGKGGAAAGHAAKARGGKAAAKPPAGKGKGNGAQKVEMGMELSFDAEFGEGDFDLEEDLVDVNGDGLPDRVRRVPLSVDNDGDGRTDSILQAALNLGYRFGAFETWGTGTPNASASNEHNLGLGLGFNVGDFSFAGGAASSWVNGEVAEELVDINGDGLVDRLRFDGATVTAGINTGGGFAPPVPWSPGTGVTSTAVSLGGGVYFTVPIGPLCLVGCYIIVNPGGDYERSITRQKSDLRDVDGDGCADLVETDRDDQLTVSPNRTGRTNLLASVARPLGGTIALEYRRDGNTYEMPESRWVLAKTTVGDGWPGDGVDEQRTVFQYAGGRSDRWEREFYGYGTVVATLLDAGGQPYRSVTRTYANTGFYSRGLLLDEAVADGEGRKYVETRHTWLLRDVETGQPLAATDDDVATVFPELRRTDRLFSEGADAPGTATAILYEHALKEGAPGVKWSNLVQVVDLGDEGPEDDVRLDVGYFADTAAHIVGKPDALRYSAQGRELQRSGMTIEAGTGDVTQVREYLADGAAATTDYAYDPYGNTLSATFPPNLRGQRYAVAYGYDDRVFTHLARISDSHGDVSTARHDLAHGKPLLETDINGNTLERGYDGFGRLLFAIGPYEAGAGLDSVRHVYHHGEATPWAMTRRVDRFDPAGDTIDRVVFVDGLGRVTQTKRDASVHQGAGVAAARVMAVSGDSKFDFAGRTVAQRHPVTEAVGTPGVPNTRVDGVEPSRTTWDVLDRTTSLALPDGSVTRYEFGFGRDRRGAQRLLARAIDARGAPREIYRDARGLVVGVKESAGGGSPDIWTSYEYDPLRRLVAVTDDRGNAVAAEYDNLGRRTALESPDGGRTEARYDLAANVVERVTANLRLSGRSILHDYDFNRLTAIAYPAFPENNVTIAWGRPGAGGNGAGRIVRVGDESGVEEFRYGPLGEVAVRTRTVASDTQGRSAGSPEVYVTRQRHDTWGRLGLLTYPDGEELTHRYDSGGLLRELTGAKGGNRYVYVRRLEYDKFLDRAFVLYGNGVATSYGRNPRNRCLEVVQSGAGPGRGGFFQDLRLSCDRVGNVTRARNLAATDSPRWLGGATDYSFVYDDLNRLTGASGLFERPREKAERFTLQVDYDGIHNITAMTRVHQVVNPSGKPVARRKTSLDARYLYGGRGAHAPDRIGAARLEWDANGNQIVVRAPGQDGRRTLVWDEENRLQAVSLNGHTIRYKYDAAGVPVVTRGPQGETVLVNRYLSMRNREVGLKHFFAGDERVATKLMKQDRPGANPAGRPPVEKDVYFYHGDQIGSTTFVTDAQGELYEHREYFPFGGVFVDESANTRRAPYQFAARELDDTTGYYSFDGRPYDPETALWLSAEPTLRAAFPGAGAHGDAAESVGVYETRNLNPYGYAGQNPVTNVGSEMPPFSRPALTGATLLRSPGMGRMPAPAGLPPIPYPHLELPWWMATGGGAPVSGWWASAPSRWGVGQLTQDQAQSAEEAPATGALHFEFGFAKEEMKKLGTAMKDRPKALAAAKEAAKAAAAAKKAVAPPAADLDAAGGPDVGGGAPQPQPQSRRRAVSAP